MIIKMLLTRLSLRVTLLNGLLRRSNNSGSVLTNNQKMIERTWTSQLKAKRMFSSNIEVSLIMDDGQECVAEGEEDETLFDVVLNSDLDVEGYGACGGMAACSTCHLIFDQKVYDNLEPPEDHEMDILDQIPLVTNTSRLGCQVKLTEKLRGVRIIVPSIRSDLREK